MKLLPLTFSSSAEEDDNMRGLEDCTVPWLGMKRRVDRVNAIQLVVKAQRNLCRPKEVRDISRRLTKPARMGQVLAMADAKTALFERIVIFASLQDLPTKPVSKTGVPNESATVASRRAQQIRS